MSDEKSITVFAIIFKIWPFFGLPAYTLNKESNAKKIVATKRSKSHIFFLFVFLLSPIIYFREVEAHLHIHSAVGNLQLLFSYIQAVLTLIYYQWNRNQLEDLLNDVFLIENLCFARIRKDDWLQRVKKTFWLFVGLLTFLTSSIFLTAIIILLKNIYLKIYVFLFYYLILFSNLFYLMLLVVSLLLVEYFTIFKTVVKCSPSIRVIRGVFLKINLLFFKTCQIFQFYVLLKLLSDFIIFGSLVFYGLFSLYFSFSINLEIKLVFYFLNLSLFIILFGSDLLLAYNLEFIYQQVRAMSNVVNFI